MLSDVFKITKDKVKFEKGFGLKSEKVLSLKGERIQKLFNIKAMPSVP